jgi:L-fuculose-phosphate aldolase
LASYATTGTAEVAPSMRPFISEHDAILLENHGAVSYGVTLLEAFMKMETVEHLAHVALVAHQHGSAHPLGRDQVQQLQSARTKYVENVQEGLSPQSRKEQTDRIAIDIPENVIMSLIGKAN